MPAVEEGLSARTEIGTDLAAGTKTISLDQEIKFVRYVKLVLPIDGYVFWVRADIVSKGALANASLPNAFTPNEFERIATAAPTMKVLGSLHYATDNKQNPEASYAVNRVVFTSLSRINPFEDVGPTTIWIGEFEGLKFAFSSRKSFYLQSGLHHYVGDAVYPIMASQLIDSLDGFSSKAIVSNSLPLWLSINGRATAAWEPFGAGLPRLYPAYLAKDNIVPPFATVDVTSTTPIASAPTVGRRLSHDQQVRDKVKITLWGLNNDEALNFIDFVNQLSLDTNIFGLANSPMVRDEKVTQPEIETIAKKKVIEYEINYHQLSARDVARTLIRKAVPSFQIFN